MNLPRMFFANIGKTELTIHMMGGCGVSMDYAIPALEEDMYLDGQYQDLGLEDVWLIKVCPVCKELYGKPEG